MVWRNYKVLLEQTDFQPDASPFLHMHTYTMQNLPVLRTHHVLPFLPLHFRHRCSVLHVTTVRFIQQRFHRHADESIFIKWFPLDFRRAIREEIGAVVDEIGFGFFEAFADRNVETEVFMKAKLLAENEAEEQKNQQCYRWY